MADTGEMGWEVKEREDMVMGERGWEEGKDTVGEEEAKGEEAREGRRPGSPLSAPMAWTSFLTESRT